MKKSLSKALAVSAVCAAGLASTLGGTPAIAAPHHVSKPASAVSQFGYKANAFGTKVIVNNVELRTVKDAAAQQKCTRRVGQDQIVGSAISNEQGGLLPIPNDLVKVSPSTSTTSTYKTVTGGKTTYGVRGVNTIAAVDLGGEVAGNPTPVIKIEGLQSTANSFNTAGKFGYESAFAYKGLSLQLPEGNPVSDSLQTLFDALGVGPDQVNDVIAVPVDTLISVLQTVGTIDIPGLGTVALGSTNGVAKAHSAYAETYALKIAVTATGDTTALQLGRAAARITDGVKSGVFRSSMSALDLHLGDLAQLGNVLQRSIPCEGTTGGKVVTSSVNSASVLGGQLVNLEGIKYAYSGSQYGKGLAKGMVSTSIAKASIPAANLEVDGITSQVTLKSLGKGHEVKRNVKVNIAQVLYNGEKLTLNRTGETQLPDGSGVLKYRVISDNDYYGTQVTALTVTLFSNNSIIDLGKAAGRVFFR